MPPLFNALRSLALLAVHDGMIIIIIIPTGIPIFVVFLTMFSRPRKELSSEM